jgi:hypothetical protein
MNVMNVINVGSENVCLLLFTGYSPKDHRIIFPHVNHIFDDRHLSPDQWMKISFIPYCYNKGVQYLYLGFS